MDLTKIPFLKDVDFSNPVTKKKVFLLLVAFVSTVGLIIYIVKDSTGKPIAEEQQQTATTVAPSIQIQLGEDNDQLSGNNNRSIYNSSRSGSLMDELFPSEDKGDKKEDSSDPLGVIRDGKVVSDAQKQQQAVTSEFDAVLNGAKQNVYGTQQQDELTEEREAEKKHQERMRLVAKKKREMERRQQLIDMGFDPDTGEYIGDKSSDKQSATAQPQRPASSGSGRTASSATSTPAPQPEPVQEKKPEQTNVEVSLTQNEVVSDDDMFGVGTVDIGSITENKKRSDQIAIKVMFAEEKKVKSGDRIQIRLREESGFILNGVHIPKNTLLFANVIVGDRIYIKVSSLNINGQILPFNYEAYDNDGERGIYCPTSAAKETIDNVTQQAENIASTALQSTMRTYGARLVQLVSGEANNKKNTQSVYLSSGYAFYLMACE